MLDMQNNISSKEWLALKVVLHPRLSTPKQLLIRAVLFGHIAQIFET